MSLITLEKKVNQLIAAQEIQDWFPEKEGFMGIDAETLRKLREDPVHASGWRFKPTAKSVDKLNRVVRRNIIWSKRYLFSLFISTSTNTTNHESITALN